MAYKNYKELTVWQRAMELTDEIYALAKKLPREETYGLSDQMRRAVVSIPSNIAEGQGRQTDREFRHFLSIANGSCMELETQLYICIRQKYFTEEEVQKALLLSNEINRMLSAFIMKLKA